MRHTTAVERNDYAALYVERECKRRWKGHTIEFTRSTEWFTFEDIVKKDVLGDKDWLPVMDWSMNRVDYSFCPDGYMKYGDISRVTKIDVVDLRL